MRSERIWGIWVLTSDKMLKAVASLHDVRINPQKLNEVVEHYSIPAWVSLNPELVQSNDIESNKIILPDEEHILVSCLNPSTHKVWRVAKNNSNIRRVASTEWAVVIPHNFEDIDYINSALESYPFQFQMNGYVTGTTNSHQRVKKSDFLGLIIPFPDEQTRNKIGEFHKLIREKTASNQKISEYISDYISVLFRSWFIVFDPIKAKAEGRLPFGMDKETASLFPDSFENSENGGLPKGWTWGTLLDISKIWTGGTPKTSESSYWGGDIPWVSGADLSSNDLFAFDSARKITSLGVEKSSTKVLPVGTVMITARGTVGATKITAVPMAMSQTSFGFKAKKGISDALVYQASQETIRQLRSFAYGAVFDTFTQGTIDITKIAIAPLEILQAFGKIVDPLFETMKNSAKEIIELSSTREALLPRLMSGELKVN
jgi:type I restriction enzyme, S subunit